jgi:hypothetical protein
MINPTRKNYFCDSFQNKTFHRYGFSSRRILQHIFVVNLETYNFYEQLHLVADCPICPLCMWSTRRLGRSLALLNTMNDGLERATVFSSWPTCQPVAPLFLFKHRYSVYVEHRTFNIQVILCDTQIRILSNCPAPFSLKE